MAIAGALVHQAEVLLLDEPTVGLDPHQRRRFLDLLVSLRGTVHVIVSTHDIGDLDGAFDEVVVFESGRARFQGPVALFDSYAAPDCAPAADWRARTPPCWRPRNDHLGQSPRLGRPMGGAARPRLLGPLHHRQPDGQ
ncbi:AAA family ATPase [Streptomyces sp. NPDC097617]|uniref:AAA family ATPase n=1 Tax=Streptomyces sp. NPDC097617 TaxID=3366091 RepID=UPI00381788B0